MVTLPSPRPYDRDVKLQEIWARLGRVSLETSIYNVRLLRLMNETSERARFAQSIIMPCSMTAQIFGRDQSALWGSFPYRFVSQVDVEET